MISQKYYETLGVNRNSSENDIKIAYKQLAKKYHPDLNKEPDAKERFIEIHNAYETIINQPAPSIDNLMDDIFGKTSIPSIDELLKEIFSKEGQERSRKERERPRPMSEVLNNIIKDIAQYCSEVLDSYFIETDSRYKHTFKDWNDNFEELTELKEEIFKRSWQYNLEDDGTCHGDPDNCPDENYEYEVSQEVCPKCFEEEKESWCNSYKRSIDIGFAYIRAYLEATPKYYKPLRKEYNLKKVKTGNVKNWINKKEVK